MLDWQGTFQEPEYHLRSRGEDFDQTAATLIVRPCQLRTEREDRRHETSSFDRCGGGRRARVFSARLGTAGQSVRWQLYGYARPEPRWTGTDALQLWPPHDSSPAALGARSGNGSVGDAAVIYL